MGYGTLFRDHRWPRGQGKHHKGNHQYRFRNLKKRTAGDEKSPGSDQSSRAVNAANGRAQPPEGMGDTTASHDDAASEEPTRGPCAGLLRGPIPVEDRTVHLTMERRREKEMRKDRLLTWAHCGAAFNAFAAATFTSSPFCWIWASITAVWLCAAVASYRSGR